MTSFKIVCTVGEQTFDHKLGYRTEAEAKKAMEDAQCYDSAHYTAEYGGQARFSVVEVLEDQSSKSSGSHA